jgi:potassium/hydrogen antiporter
MTERFLQQMSHVKNYMMILGLLALSWIVSQGADDLLQTVFSHLGDTGSTLTAFFEILIVFIFGFLVYEVAKPTVIPSFVLAIFIGMLQKDALTPITNNPVLLTILTTLGAAFILFGGGLDTPFGHFRKLLGPILSIAFIGTLVTAFLFSTALFYVSGWLGVAIPLGAAIVIGAALASTDPAAIIPSFKTLSFKKFRVKYIAVSESAINDVVGAVLTGVFLTLLLTDFIPSTIGQMYGQLLTLETGFEVMKELLIGCFVGGIGFLILFGWNRWKTRAETGGEADAALFLAVPLFCYTLATALHGSGFLAVFISSLLFHIEEHFTHVEHYFNHTIEAFMKPLIFMLLGAVVDFQALMEVAPLGITMGLIFMFVLRPLAVFLTIGPFMAGKHKMSVRELVFLSFVRETGVIPAVLLMSLRVSGLPGADTVVAVGLWVILLTLIIQPPFTPFVAKALGVATDIPPFPVQKHVGSAAVLCSRGLSFLDRLPMVADWAEKHGIKNLILLHSAEDKYTESYAKNIKEKAEALYATLARKFDAEKRSIPKFEFLARPGLLQDNIEQLLGQSNVSIVFVGKKMLDYRLDDVKRLQVPFVFVP